MQLLLISGIMVQTFCFLMIVVMSGLSCQTARSQSGKNQLSTPFNGLDANGPGIIKIKGSLKEIHAGETSFCGRSLINLAKVNVTEVLTVGPGISRPPLANQEISLQFYMGFQAKKLNDEISLSGLAVGDSFIAQVREKPCFGTSEVYYEVFVYTVE